MHIGFPLLLAYNARSKWLRVWLWAFVAIMLVATLALREHYLIDLIAAFPVLPGLQWIAVHLPLIQKRERSAPARGWGAHGDRKIMTSHVAE
jgi:membrane-associated phospholipid phosphatase